MIEPKVDDSGNTNSGRDHFCTTRVEIVERGWSGPQGAHKRAPSDELSTGRTLIHRRQL